MLYFSRGSVIRGFRLADGGVCPEAVGGASSDSRQAVRETKRRNGGRKERRPRPLADSSIRRFGLSVIRPLVLSLLTLSLPLPLRSIGNSRVTSRVPGHDSLVTDQLFPHGRGCGVGRGRGVGVSLGVAVGVGDGAPHGVASTTSSTYIPVSLSAAF